MEDSKSHCEDDLQSLSDDDNPSNDIHVKSRRLSYIEWCREWE